MECSARIQDYANAFNELYQMYVNDLITHDECMIQLIIIQEEWNIPLSI